MQTKDLSCIYEDLSCVYTDLLMLKDGSWEPDNDSIEATLFILEKVAERLGLSLKDKRDGIED